MEIHNTTSDHDMESQLLLSHTGSAQECEEIVINEWILFFCVLQTPWGEMNGCKW